MHLHGDSSDCGSNLGALETFESCDTIEGGLSKNHVYYYVHILHGDENTYQPCDRNVEIDPKFQCQLQQKEQAGDISRFLALPKIIPTKQCKHQQLLLDFMKSKILASHAYTKCCVRILAQRKATQAEARHKAIQRETTKETKCKEKEDR